MVRTIPRCVRACVLCGCELNAAKICTQTFGKSICLNPSDHRIETTHLIEYQYGQKKHTHNNNTHHIYLNQRGNDVQSRVSLAFNRNVRLHLFRNGYAKWRPLPGFFDQKSNLFKCIQWNSCMIAKIWADIERKETERQREEMR